MWAARSPSTDASLDEAVHISMPHARLERRYGYRVTPSHNQVVNSPLNRINSNILDLIQRDLAVPSHRQWVAQIQSRQPVNVQAVDVLQTVRVEREHETNSTES